jgi:hypothetical protein
MQPITHGSILAVFFAANDYETISGAEWYQVANLSAQLLASRYNVKLNTAAAVIAALSPNNNWERNLIDADNIIRAYTLGGYSDAAAIKTSTYGQNKKKALNILEGAEPLDILGGLKVRAFYGCIMGEDQLCVDGHAYAIWRGERITTNKTPKISPKLYASIEADYRLATDTINGVLGSNYKPYQTQAITWLTWRRLNKEAK